MCTHGLHFRLSLSPLMKPTLPRNYPLTCQVGFSLRPNCCGPVCFGVFIADLQFSIIFLVLPPVVPALPTDPATVPGVVVELVATASFFLLLLHTCRIFSCHSNSGGHVPCWACGGVHTTCLLYLRENTQRKICYLTTRLEPKRQN